MSKQLIEQFIARRLSGDGLVDTQVKGVQLFRVTHSVRCAPAIYEPTIVAIVRGSKEAILNGNRYAYDSGQYLCCTMPIPVEAGTPDASPDNPLLGVTVSLNTRVMKELAIEMESTTTSPRRPASGPLPQGLVLARWDEAFSDALLRLLQLEDSPADSAILGDGRLREVYYALMQGDAGEPVRRAFGVGNEIARAIEYLSSHLDKTVTIEDMASQAGMSRAVFHRKFKQVTTMSPVQFMKAMRLNTAAMQIASGTNVNVAATKVGYVSSSQFNREFKRLYGQSPGQWRYSLQLPANG
ncbi:AraC family transcriptional regulator [Granulosicoccus sp. 3-233]|uniref:AraC family transcriptional regulator n=1 Tax=Granulosicoccus sp. 3-233 TaxID=3417969 RepID=UPI003D34EC2A